MLRRNSGRCTIRRQPLQCQIELANLLTQRVVLMDNRREAGGHALGIVVELLDGSIRCGEKWSDFAFDGAQTLCDIRSPNRVFPGLQLRGVKPGALFLDGDDYDDATLRIFNARADVRRGVLEEPQVEDLLDVTGNLI